MLAAQEPDDLPKSKDTQQFNGRRGRDTNRAARGYQEQSHQEDDDARQQEAH